MGRRGARPYGWADNGTDLEPTEAQHLRDWAAYLLDGGTLRGLVADLINRGVPTAGGRGTWQSVTIKRALTNPRMIGKRADNGGVLIPTDVTPILDEDVYHQLVALFTSPERAKFTGDKTRVNLLSGGVARCGLCGRNLHCTVNRTTTSYKCSERAGGCGKVSVHAEHLEVEVVERVLARLTDAGFRRALGEQINALASESEAEKEIEALELRLTALGEDFADGLIARPALTAGSARARARIELLRAQQAQRELLTDIPTPDVGAVLAWWEAATKRRRRDVVAAFLDHVTVGPSERRPRAGIDLDRLRWHWRDAT